MKEKLSFLILFSLALFNINAQSAPASVCTSPSVYNYDQQVTYYFDLTGNASVAAGQNLYFYSWAPNAIVGGKKLMTYEGGMKWSLTCVPTTLYGVSAATLTASGTSGFWCNVQNSSGVAVTGTIPYAQKEQLRLGSQCFCTGTSTTANSTFFINLGAAAVANPDLRGFKWTNISQVNKVYSMVDTLGVNRHDITTSGAFTVNTNTAGFTNPNAALLGNLAVANATDSYFYTTTGTGTITISCLDTTRLFKISLFGARAGTDARVSKYTVVGKTTNIGTLQTTGTGIATNTSLTLNDDQLYTTQLFPKSNGKIEIKVEVSSGTYAYINMIKVQEIVNPVFFPLTEFTINTSKLSTSGPSQLSVINTPSNTTEPGVIWSVSDARIAIIDQNGNLKPKKAGTVTVSATSIYHPELVQTTSVTFANLVTKLYLSGTATEALYDGASYGMPMRRIYDVDSTLTNKFEIYTSLSNTGTFKLYADTSSSALAYGSNGAGKIVVGGTALTSATSGLKVLTVNLNDSTYSIAVAPGFSLISNMVAKDATQAAWWAGDEILTDYEGKGVWSATVNFALKTQAWNNPRFFFTVLGTGRVLKIIKGTKNSLLFADDAMGKTLLDIDQFNGIYKVKLNMQNYTFDVTKTCDSTDSHGVTFLGSSVSKGFGADMAVEDSSLYQGYQHQFELLTKSRHTAGLGQNWNFTNVSVGGNSTIDVKNRLSRNLYTTCGKYVIIGLSLANEGLLSGGAATVTQFTNNMLALIDTVRAHNLIPIVSGSYANNQFNATHYAYIKEMNLKIHEWNVPSTNLLGALEDGTGKWPVGTNVDCCHPSTAGYTELFHAVVPSVIDALAIGKPLPVLVNGTYHSMGLNTNSGVLSITPEDVVHSYTTSFDVKTAGSGTIASLKTASSSFTIALDTAGLVSYTSVNGSVNTTADVNDNTWHKISLTHYYTKGQTLLYVDGVLKGSLNEQVVITKVVLSDFTKAPIAVDYRNWFFYRSAMCAEEMAALNSGKMLKSSLEIYAPLDGQAVLGNDVLVNLAQSLNVVKRIADVNPEYLVDFGPADNYNGFTTASPDANSRTWNNVSVPYVGGGTVSLVDTKNVSNGSSLTVTESFQTNGIYNGGLLAPDAIKLNEFAVATATEDYFFTTGSSKFQLSGLNAGSKYIFTVFGTRNVDITRTSQYTFTGAETKSGLLQTSGVDLGGVGYNGNNSSFYVSDTLHADANGKITMQLSVVNGGFAYIGAMKIKEFVTATQSYKVDASELKKEESISSAVMVYPNPASEVLNVSFTTSSAATVTLTDIFGRTVYSTVSNVGANVIEINTSDFASGVYILNVYSTAGTATRKVSIK